MDTPVSRDEFDFGEVRWLLHCAEGPTPVAVAEAARRYMDLEVQPFRRRMQQDVIDILADARRQAATVISRPASRAISPTDITLSQSTSSALTIVARGFLFEPGDEIVAPLGEFPSNVWPWKALADKGVTFREVPLWDGHRSGRDAWTSTPPTASARPEHRLAEAIGPNTRMVTASWVRFQDGLKLDLGLLGRLCRERGVPLVIDGIQGAGAMAPDLTDVSAFATGGHKGLLAMSGQGFLWTDADFRKRLSPMGSWLSVEEGGNFDRAVTDLDRNWQDNGHKLEQGGYNIIGSLVLGGSLKLINQAGTRHIEDHVRMLQAELVRLLSESVNASWKCELERLAAMVDQGRTGPILGIHHMGKGPEFLNSLVARLHSRSIFVSLREGYLRVALHCWHNRDDIEAVAATLS